MVLSTPKRDLSLRAKRAKVIERITLQIGSGEGKKKPQSDILQMKFDIFWVGILCTPKTRCCCPEGEAQLQPFSSTQLEREDSGSPANDLQVAPRGDSGAKGLLFTWKQRRTRRFRESPGPAYHPTQGSPLWSPKHVIDSHLNTFSPWGTHYLSEPRKCFPRLG